MSKVNNILLPIAVAGILPLLGLYSRAEVILQEENFFFAKWLSTSIILFLLWHLLAFISNKKIIKNRWLALLIPIVFFGILFSFLNHKGHDIQFYHFTRAVFPTVLIMIIQFAMQSQQSVLQLTLENEQIQTENYKAQLKDLQAKIDPHFMFNSMNTLRSMVRQNHPNSEKFVISLSDFYRQTLKYNENTTIALLEEIEILQSYLFVMKNRNQDGISIHFNIDDSLYQYHLPTLALQIKIGELDSSGYGLQSLEKRYELMNISKGVIIEKSSKQFSVKLKLIKK